MWVCLCAECVWIAATESKDLHWKRKRKIIFLIFVFFTVFLCRQPFYTFYRCIIELSARCSFSFTYNSFDCPDIRCDFLCLVHFYVCMRFFIVLQNFSSFSFYTASFIFPSFQSFLHFFFSLLIRARSFLCFCLPFNFCNSIFSFYCDAKCDILLTIVW